MYLKYVLKMNIEGVPSIGGEHVIVELAFHNQPKLNTTCPLMPRSTIKFIVQVHTNVCIDVKVNFPIQFGYHWLTLCRRFKSTV